MVSNKPISKRNEKFKSLMDRFSEKFGITWWIEKIKAKEENM